MDEQEAFEDYLREGGHKMTEPRRVVLDAFLRAEKHLTAEELFGLVRRKHPGVGQATVFRTVKLLVAAGIAREARRADGGMQYEHAFRHEHHDHLVCEACGLVVEFRDEAIERAQESVYRRHGFIAGDHRMELLGLCPRCAKGGKQR